MKAEDLLSEGEKAKRHLRVAQSLALLTKSRKPSFLEVKAATTRLQAKQPAVAMAIILAQAKRQPLHERGEWLDAAKDALHAYRLSDGADQKEAELAHEHIDKELSLHKAELARLEKLRERLSLALLCLLVAGMLLGLILIGINYAQSRPEKGTEEGKPAYTITTEEKPAPAKIEGAKPKDLQSVTKPPAEKPKPAEQKKPEKESPPSKPAKK
jgi:hypothetical protein